MRVTNHSSYPQQINFINESFIVQPGQAIDINPKKIYSHELERIKKLMKVEDTEEKKESKSKKYSEPISEEQPEKAEKNESN